MAVTKCRECKKPVSTEAPSCPHCGAPSPAPARTSIAQPDEEKPVYKRGWFIALAVVFGLWLLGQGNPPERQTQNVSPERVEAPSEPRWKQRDNSTMAYLMTEDWVKARLRAPSTAKFPGIFDGRADHVAPLGEHKYRIVSWVDSQNGFGAMIRSRFVAEVQQTSENEWSLLSLDIIE